MYQPALRHDQIRSLYQLKLERDRPMTALVREAVDRYLATEGNDLSTPQDSSLPASCQPDSLPPARHD